MEWLHPRYGLIDCENGRSGDSLRLMIERAVSIETCVGGRGVVPSFLAIPAIVLDPLCERLELPLTISRRAAAFDVGWAVQIIGIGRVHGRTMNRGVSRPEVPSGRGGGGTNALCKTPQSIREPPAMHGHDLAIGIPSAHDRHLAYGIDRNLAFIVASG